ncbi:hypothetical protein B4135_3312 [Caldibacillus debilis]|uniref:Uncharacterized protein n=1 Tax=Caldibacillus debilis TaxID=301148 RepID=A0A150LFU3_9BACI|nr:hypothetical protein B4135_3312 [Caldibacillus debilis]
MIRFSCVCKILLPVQGTQPSGKGTALRPFPFAPILGLPHIFRLPAKVCYNSGSKTLRFSAG